MIVLICRKGAFDSITIRDVSNIAYASDMVTITYGATSSTLSYDLRDYMISILTV